MTKITQLPETVTVEILQGDSLDIHIPLTLDGEPLTPEQEAAYEAGIWTGQIRRTPNTPALAALRHTGFGTTVDGWGPLFRLSAADSANLPAVCVGDIQVSTGDPEDPDIQTIMRLELDVARQVTR